MDLAHAIAAGGLAARTTEHRFVADDSEIADARRRAIARRTAAADAAATTRIEYRERGRHAAPRPAQA